MARANENKRHSKYAIRIVCEGDKTEPLFFTDLCDQFYGDSKDLMYVQFRSLIYRLKILKRILPEEAIKGRNVKSSIVDRKMLLKMKL